MHEPCVIGTSNLAFIRKKILKTTFHSVKFVDTLFPVYNQNIDGYRRTPSLLSTEYFLKWSNEN